MNSAKVITSLFAIGALFSCGKSADKVEDFYELQGNYQTTAQTELSLQAGGIGCMVRTMDVNLYQMTLVAKTYSDANCQGTKLGEITFKGSYSIEGNSDVAPGARMINMKVDAVLAKPEHADWATVFSKDLSGDCRLHEVALGQEKHIEGLNCGALGRMPARDQFFVTTFKIEGNDLLFTKFPHEAPKSVANTPAEAVRASELTFRFIRN